MWDIYKMQNKNFFYGNELSKYFSEKISKYPFVIDFLDEDIINDLSRISTIAKFLENIFQGKKIQKILEQEESILKKFQDMRTITKKLLADKKPIITPFGFNIKKEKNFLMLFELIRYHGINDAFRLLNYLWDKILRNFDLDNIPEFLKNMANDFQNQPIENEDMLFSVFFDIFSDYSFIMTFERAIIDYTTVYDNIMSFFIRPFGQKSSNLEQQKIIIKKVQRRIPDDFNKFFTNMDYQLRNALVHRNYYIDDTTKELVYNSYIKKNKYEINKINLQTLKDKVYDLLTTSISFFFGLFIELFLWINKNFDEILQFIFLWNINLEKDLLFSINEFIGLPLDLTIEFDNVYKKDRFLEASMLEIRSLVTLSKDKYPTRNGEKNLDQFIIDFWDDFNKKYSKVKKKHAIVFGYALYTLSGNKSKVIPTLISSYTNFLNDIGIDLNKNDMIKEIILSTKNTNPNIMNDLIADFNEDITKEKMDEIIIDIIKRLEIFDESQIITFDELTNIPFIYQRLVRELAFFHSSKEIEEYYKVTNLLSNLLIVVKTLKEEKKSLTGSQLTDIIRKKEGYANWPSPSFPKVIKCLKILERMNYIKVAKPKQSDIIITLLDKKKK